MALNLANLVGTMKSAGITAFGNIWNDIKAFLLPELRKLAFTFIDIEKGLAAKPPIYTRASAKILTEMQINSLKTILTAMTALTIIAIQAALNAILGAVRDTVNSAIGFALI